MAMLIAGRQGGKVGANDAIDVSITDVGGHYTGTEVETALQEIGAANHSHSNKAYLDEINQNLAITDEVSFSKVSVTDYVKTTDAYRCTFKVLTNADSPYTVTDSEPTFIGLDTSGGDISIVMADISAFSGTDVDSINFFKVADENKAIFSLAVSTQTLGDFSVYHLESKGLGIRIVRNRGTDKYWATSIGTNTNITAPSVATNTPTLASTTLSMSGELLDMAGSSSLDVYFEYRDITSTTWTTTTHNTKTSTGNFTDTATVTAGETYEVRAATHTTDGTVYYGAILTTGVNYYNNIDAAKTNGLIRYWAMQETSGTNTTADEAIFADNMAMYNGVTVSNDTINSTTIYKRVFGANDYGEASFQLNKEGKYTFLLQVDINGITGDHTIFSNGANIFSLAGDADDIQLSVNNNLETWTSALPFSSIKNLFVTYDYAAWKVELWEVTSSLATSRLTSWNMPSTNGSSLRLGRGYSGDGNHQDNEYLNDGEVRSMAIWDRVLTDTEMKNICDVLDNDGGLIVTDSSYTPVPAEHGVNASIKDHRDVDSGTDPADGQILEYNSTDAVYTPVNQADHLYCKTVNSPTASEDTLIGFTYRAITITEIQAVVRGATPSVTIAPKHNTDRSAAGNSILSSATAITNTTTGQNLTNFSDATIPADSWIWLETTAASGTIDELNITIKYEVD